MDPKNQLLLVVFLGLTVLFGLVGVIYLGAHGKTVDSVIVASMSTALGALAGMLTQARGSASGQTGGVVVNTTNQAPAPVVDAKP